MTADEIARIRAEALEEAARVALAHAEERRQAVADYEGVDQTHTASEAWQYAVDEACEIAADIRALIPKEPTPVGSPEAGG